jgi:hypothetical protein
MKKSYVISLGAISLIADIITLTSAFKWVLTNWLGVSEETATSINTWVLIGGILLLLFVLYLIYKMVKDKLIDAGTHGIACEIVPYYRYKVRNRMNTMLRLLHCNLYHTLLDSKNRIQIQKLQRDEEQRNNPLSANDIRPQIIDMLRNFHRTLYDVFRLDLSISFYLSGTENNNTVLTRCLFMQSLKEQNRGENRQQNYKYIIQPSAGQSLDDYALNASNYIRQHPNSTYMKNSIFDYVLTTNNPSWMSNDLSVDEANSKFYTSSRYYRQRYKSMAVFAIIPPNNANNRENAIKGLLTFDSCNTRIFSEEECTMLMGLMAHQLYELLACLN